MKKSPTNPNLPPEPNTELPEPFKTVQKLNPKLLQELGAIFPRAEDLLPLSFELTLAVAERFKYRDRFLDLIEETCAKNLYPWQEREPLFRQFDRRVVKEMLLASFLPALLAKEEMKRVPSRKILEQKVIDIGSVVLRLGDLDPSVEEGLLREVMRVETALKQQRQLNLSPT